MVGQMRLWIEGDEVRLAHDLALDTGYQPEHLEEGEDGLLVWAPHPEGGNIPAIPLAAFIAWLDQGGADRPPGVVGSDTPTKKE